MKRRSELEASNRTYEAAQDKMSILTNYYKWIYGVSKGYISGSVIELGVGAGYYTENYSNEVTEITLVDFNPVLLEKLKARIGNARIVNQNLTQTKWENLTGNDADTVIALDVMEHFENDLQFLRNAAELLRDRGRIILKVPAQPKLYSSIDESSGHYRRYDMDRFSKMTKECALEIEQAFEFNRFGALLYRFKKNRKSNFSKTFSPVQLKCGNLLIPLISCLDWVLPGKGLSLIVVLRKHR